MIKILVLSLLVLTLITVAPTAKAEILVVGEKTQTVTGHKRDAWREFSLRVQRKEVYLPGVAREFVALMTDIRMIYDAGSPAQVVDFALVQWIRGCQFESQFDGRNVTKDVNISRLHFGVVKPFLHRDWEIDSDSSDPIYTSFENAGRHALLRWNADPNSLNPETAHYLAEQPTPHGRVFATDLPGSAMKIERAAGRPEAHKNTSLEFRTCLYRTVDLPTATTPNGANIDQAKAIKCFEWEHKYVFNYRKHKWSSKGSIDPICR